jgi:Domain of unknown function (DUF5076)
MPKQTLPVPPAATRDPNAIEMARAWIAENALHCSVMMGIWDERDRKEPGEAWGILLADLARHYANALEEDQGISAEDTRVGIMHSFNSEIRRPTSSHSGEFVPKRGRRAKADSPTKTRRPPPERRSGRR